MMEYAIYVAVKLLSYSLWCWIGLRWIWPGSASFARAIAFGLLRLLIGIFFGVVVFFSFSSSPDHLLFKYVAIYAPLRLIEWSILAGIIRWTTRTSQQNASLLPPIFWCIGGILVSFAADFASPEGVAGHFCVGRCLC